MKLNNFSSFTQSYDEQMHDSHAFPEKKFLIRLFSNFNKVGIDYCVLRNYEMLPFSVGDSDLDILIGNIGHSQVLSIFVEVAKKNDLKLIVKYHLTDFYRFCYLGQSEEEAWGVQLDIHTDESYKGLPFFDRFLILSQALIFNELKVASDDDAMIVALLKESLSNGVSRKGYEQKAMDVYRQKRQFYNDILTKYFGGKAATEWDEFFMSTSGRQSLKRISRVSRHSLLIKAFTSHPFSTVVKKIKYNYFKWRRLFKPIGFSVSFIGTDGSGKSTIIEGIRPPLESALHSKLKYEHMRPNLLPSLARLLGGRLHEPGKPVENPHASKSSGSVGSLFRLIYYSLDYMFGYWLKVFPHMVKKPCLYVFDRYFYDFMLDPVRSRISLPKKMVECFRIVIPEPNLILCLGADPEIIHARKPELPLSEVVRQVDELRKFCDETPRAVWIDTGLTVEKSTNLALSAIVDKMASRYD